MFEKGKIKIVEIAYYKNKLNSKIKVKLHLRMEIRISLWSDEF